MCKFRMIVLFILLAVIVAVYITYNYYKFHTEGFYSAGTTELPHPVAYDDGRQTAGIAMSEISEKLLSSNIMNIADSLTNFGKLTSQKCFKSDKGETLKLTRNYLQRTNNYIHSHPDSCSAPNHELIGTFYTPNDGVGNTPKSGTNFPASLCS